MEPGALNLACTDVYNLIWHHTVKYGKPPAAADVCSELALQRWEFKQVIDKLRARGRIERGSLVPSAYRVWQRNQSYTGYEYTRSVS